MSNPRLRYYPIDAFVFFLLVTGFRNPFDEKERREKLQERHEWLSRLRRELLELVDFDELMLDLALRLGNVSNRVSAEHFQISSSKANRAGHRGHFLIETGTVAKLTLALMKREGDSIIVPGQPPQVLRSRKGGFVVPFANLTKEYSQLPIWRQVARFIRKHWNVVHSPESCTHDNPPVIAGWVDDGQFSVHVANVVESHEEAISVAKKCGVNVVYDFAARSVINIGDPE